MPSSFLVAVRGVVGRGGAMLSFAESARPAAGMSTRYPINGGAFLQVPPLIAAHVLQDQGTRIASSHPLGSRRSLAKAAYGRPTGRPAVHSYTPHLRDYLTSGHERSTEFRSFVFDGTGPNDTSFPHKRRTNN